METFANNNGRTPLNVSVKKHTFSIQRNKKNKKKNEKKWLCVIILPLT